MDRRLDTKHKPKHGSILKGNCIDFFIFLFIIDISLYSLENRMCCLLSYMGDMGS